MSEMAIMNTRPQDCTAKTRGSNSAASDSKPHESFSSLVEKNRTDNRQDKQPETKESTSIVRVKLPSDNKNSLVKKEVNNTADKSELPAGEADEDVELADVSTQAELFAILNVMPQQVNSDITEKSNLQPLLSNVDCQQAALSLAYLQKLNPAGKNAMSSDGIPTTSVFTDNLNSNIGNNGENAEVANTVIQPVLVDKKPLLHVLGNQFVPKVTKPNDLAVSVYPANGISKEEGASPIDTLLNELSATEVNIVPSKVSAEQKLNYLVPLKDNSAVIQQAGMNLASQASYLIIKPQTVEKSANVSDKTVESLPETTENTFAATIADTMLEKKLQKLNFKNGNTVAINQIPENPQQSTQVNKFTKNLTGVTIDAAKGSVVPDEFNSDTSKVDEKSNKNSDYLPIGQTHKFSESLVTTEVQKTNLPMVEDPHHIINQILDQAKLNARQENSEMIIKLKPEHLGEITLKVSVENGLVSTSIKSTNPEVRNLIEASLPQLKQELSNLGLKVDNVGVYSGLAQGFADGQREQRFKQHSTGNSNKKSGRDFIEAIEGVGVEESQPGQPVDSEVDYRI